MDTKGDAGETDEARVKGLHLCEGQVRDKKVTQAFTVGRHWSLVRRPMAQLALCFR